jgi:predicted transcriptional regulator
MGKYKEEPRYTVISMRVSDEEKALLDEMRRTAHKSISTLMREAVFRYTSQQEPSYQLSL